MAQNPYSGGTPTVQAEVDQPVDPLQRINVNPDTFGAQVGRGLSVVGGSLSDLSQVWGSVQADAATNSAMTQLGNTVDQFKSLNGQDALNAQQATLKSIQQIFENNRKSLSPQAALEFDRATERYRWDANSVVSTHADQQGKVYADQINKSSFDIAMTGIANTAVDDPMMAMWWRERARTAAVKSMELAGDGNNPVLRQNAIQKADQASAKAYIGALEAKDPVLALKVANEPYFKKDLGVEYSGTVQRLQEKADAASGRGASITAIAKAQNDANTAALGGQPASGRENVIGQSQGQAASTIYNAVLARGYNPAQAAALVGNMKQESEFNPTAPNPTEGGIGLLQWREERRVQLENSPQ